MKVVQEYQGQCDDFMLRRQLRDRQVRMLAFLYNAEIEIAAEKFDQKYAIYSELKSKQKSQSIKTEEVKRLFNVLSQKVHQRILRQNIQCDKALNKLETLWENRKIQPFHRYYFEKYINTTYLQNVHTLIKRQDLLIRQEQHIYFSILRAIWAREACMNHLNRQLKQLSPEDMYEHFNTVKERSVQRNRKIEQRQYKVHGYRALYRLDYQEVSLGRTKMQDFFLDVNNYRKLTVHLVELIVKWKEYMCSLTHDLKKRKERIEYYYEEKNHLLKILNDIQFISQSFLSNFYTFSIRNDPFLLKPILNLEKKQQQNEQLAFQELQLKQLIQVQPVYLPKIMEAMQQLHNELDLNVRNRKSISQFALNKVKNMSMDQLNKIKSQQKSPLRKIKLSSIQQKQACKDTTGKKRLTRETSMTKSNVIIRKSSPQIRQSNRSFYDNPQSSSNPFKMIDSDKLKSIKEEVFNKVRIQLEYETKKSLLKSKQFERLIDIEVKSSMRQRLEKQKKTLKEAAWEVSPISYREQEIGSYLAYVFKFIPANYLELQKTQKQLASIILDLEYCYFLKIHSGSDQVAHVIARVNRQIKGYKSIQILLVAFKHGQFLQKVILRTVEFIWKYENAKEVVFVFTHSTENNQTYISELKQRLKLHCSIVEKKSRSQTESKFIFVKKGVNQNYVHNPYPEQIHFKLYSILATERLKHEVIRDHSMVHLHYQYLIIEVLKRFTNSQDFKVLRDTFRPKDRFRNILAQLIELQNHQHQAEQLKQISAENIRELNHQLTLLKKPSLELSDFNNINSLRMLMFEMTLVPAYSLKVLSNWQGQKMHRYYIHQTLDCFVDEQQTEFYLLDVQNNHHLKILVFKADKYLEKYKNSLSSYLYKKVEKFSQSNKKFIENLWISMSRYPQNSKQQEQRKLRTFSCDQFASINKQMYIGDCFDWFTDIQIQNGLKYEVHKEDVVMTKPLGIGVVTNAGGLLYCRVIM